MAPAVLIVISIGGSSRCSWPAVNPPPRIPQVQAVRPFTYEVPFDFENRQVEVDEIIMMHYTQYNSFYGPHGFVKRVTEE